MQHTQKGTKIESKKRKLYNGIEDNFCIFMQIFVPHKSTKRIIEVSFAVGYLPTNQSDKRVQNTPLNKLLIFSFSFIIISLYLYSLRMKELENCNFVGTRNGIGIFQVRKVELMLFILLQN